VRVVVEIQELFASEMGVIVHDDAVRNPEAMDDVSEEQRGLL
jgi:hypothetical protein